MWRIKISEFVGREDFKSISPGDRQKIIDAAIEKLSRDPHAYGKPLKPPYKGYWRLRVGIYRVVYAIIEQEIVVLIILIGKRKDDSVYKELAGRLHKISRN